MASADSGEECKLVRRMPAMIAFKSGDIFIRWTLNNDISINHKETNPETSALHVPSKPFSKL
jgi:hypothetical protein